MHTATLRDRTFEGEQAPEWATAVSRLYGRWYWEESLEQQPGHRFLMINGFNSRTRTYKDTTVTGFDASYYLPPLQDDPLPPVPDSVEYREALLPQLYFRAALRCDNLGITLSMADPMVLDADSVLQLAHDLHRMAMQIKRNQKQGQAQ